MSKINVLQPNVFNMIAAGEVVERPASVVKELVENSIDAGATQIDILIEGGGTKRIQISDNGIGIQKDDIKNAFLPHATSKLKNIVDLDSISTLGFRGEALASISSVSEVELVSYNKKDECASKINLSGGNITYQGITARNQGTIITVDNLFFNTPARLKFLKKETTEFHYIADMIKALCLANPSIAITLADNNQIHIAQEGGSLLDSISSVYNSKSAENMIEVDYDSPSGICVKGYTSKIDFTKSNRTYQTIIVNGRAVKDISITTAVEKAYNLMKRNYPMYVLDIIVPFDSVDVNVHPSKTEVRFSDKKSVFSAVYHAISDAISKDSLQISSSLFEVKTQKSDIENSSYTKNNNENFKNIASDLDSQINENNKHNTSSNDKKQSNEFFTTNNCIQSKLNTSSLYSFNKKSHSAKFELHNTAVGDFTSNKSLENQNIGNNELMNNNNLCDNSNTKIINSNLISKDFTHSSNLFDGNIIGQVFDTYLLVEVDNILYIIDQHAAHERILYDILIEKLDEQFSQSLLIPYKFKLSASESEYFDKIMPSLNKIGFEVEYKFGNYIVYAIPEPIIDMDFNKFMSELFKNMLAENEINLLSLIKDKICQQACKAAIKGGDHLSRAQIQKVIENFLDKDGNFPTHCPHGRPAIVKATKKDFEKIFKRIV